MNVEPKPLTGINLKVFNRFMELTKGRRADVLPQQLLSSWPGSERMPTIDQIKAAMVWLRNEHYLCALTVYGIGGAGVDLFEARQEAARHAAEEAEEAAAARAAA